MMNRELLELYSDYLLSAFSHTTATGLSAMTSGAVSHDRITRFLASEEFGSAALWRLVKPMVPQLEDESEQSGVLIIDDTIEEKPYTDESELICWHYDHSQGRSVKGVNLISTPLPSRAHRGDRGGRRVPAGRLQAGQEERAGLR